MLQNPHQQPPKTGAAACCGRWCLMRRTCSRSQLQVGSFQNKECAVSQPTRPIIVCAGRTKVRKPHTYTQSSTPDSVDVLRNTPTKCTPTQRSCGMDPAENDKSMCIRLPLADSSVVILLHFLCYLPDGPISACKYPLIDAVLGVGFGGSSLLGRGHGNHQYTRTSAEHQPASNCQPASVKRQPPSVECQPPSVKSILPSTTSRRPW